MRTVTKSKRPAHRPPQVTYRSAPMQADIKAGFRPRPKLSRPSVTMDDVLAYTALLLLAGTVVYSIRGNNTVTVISVLLNIFFGLYFITKKFK